jgi:succinoglycan biosynthesis protein ExoM
MVQSKARFFGASFMLIGLERQIVNSIKKIAVAICTYNRNEALSTLLKALLLNASRVAKHAIVGVVVVDDSIDGKAQAVAQRYNGCFPLGITYRVSGRQNISLARNLAIETASEVGDWIAMIDDDCEPTSEWLEVLLETQERTGADAITGTMIRRVPKGSPKWLTEEPFLELGLDHSKDAAEVTTGSTFNSMISSRWLREHPTIRFQQELGVIGGEDMAFYRSAHAAGLRIHFASRATVYENEPAERATFIYQLRYFFWHGNSSYIASVRTGTHPIRMFLHGVNSLRQALLRPISLMVRGRPPQLRYCLASVVHALGKIIGPFGIRVPHC